LIPHIVGAFCEVQAEYMYFRLLKVFGSVLVPAVIH